MDPQATFDRLCTLVALYDASLTRKSRLAALDDIEECAGNLSEWLRKGAFIPNMSAQEAAFLVTFTKGATYGYQDARRHVWIILETVRLNQPKDSKTVPFLDPLE